ncbi:hypothetical protein HYX12_03325, partial [Candidatus Woesearchaeota archaeon]|nr:hypothetical protein [Candidatus Woesearchaeota archaeon]
MDTILEHLGMYLGIALGSYTILLIGAQAFGSLATQKITSQKQLDQIVDEEAEKLGMDKRTLVGKFYAVDDLGYHTIRGARCY